MLRMYRNREKRKVRMSGLVYPQARHCYSFSGGNAEYDMPGISRGFTLIELIIVIVIISIAALTAIPMMSSAASVQIRSAANMLTADLEYAKSMAISRGQKFSVVFDKDTEKYWIEDQNGNVIAHPVKKGFDYVVDFQNDSRLNKVDIVDADFDTTSEVKFDYLGSPYNGNSTPLNSGVISLQAGGTNTTVRVEAVTGFVLIE